MAKYKLGEWIVGPKGSWYQIDDMNETQYYLLTTKGKREMNSIEMVDKLSVRLSVWDIIDKIPSEILQNLDFE